MSSRKSTRIRKATVKAGELLYEKESSSRGVKRIKTEEYMTPKLTLTPVVFPLRSNLRTRQEKNYKEDSFGESLFDDDNLYDKDYVVKAGRESGSEGSDSEFFSTKKQKLNHSRVKDVSFLDVFETIDPTDEENEYRLQRQKNMQDRFKVLDSLDFDSEKKVLKSAVKVISKPKPERRKPPVKLLQPREPIKRSLRLQNRSLNLSLDGTKEEPELQFGSFTLNNEEQEDDRFLDENVPFIEEDAENNMIEVLKALKNDINLPYEETVGFSSSDSEKYLEVVKSCTMRAEPYKVIQQRITAMDFHPSSKRLLLLAGDKSGNIALQDIVRDDMGIEFRAHSRSVNCVTFSTQDHAKFFSTGLEGRVRQGDVNSSNSTVIYEADRGEHTTWHHEFGHSLLVAEGKGVVKIVDLRTSGDQCVSFKCHPRSVRTVQLHPTDENYFLTSSGSGEFGIFDLRASKPHEPNPVILQTFDKALTSAFLSAKGNYVVSTCNDDTIRVFDVNDLQKSTQISKFKHNNHTGRWLSVLKAKWHPGRDDVFLVGSMMSDPRRFQLYHRNGDLLHQFASEELMVTYTPVIAAHSSQPVFVGGNGSGKIHTFSPFPLEEIYS